MNNLDYIMNTGFEHGITLINEISKQLQEGQTSESRDESLSRPAEELSSEEIFEKVESMMDSYF